MPGRETTKHAAARFTKADAQRLREHLATEAADAGLRSSHGSLVRRVEGGTASGGPASVEDRIQDRRFGWGGEGRAGEGTAAGHRRIHGAITALVARAGFTAAHLQAALHATYGPSQRPWHPQVRHALAALGDEIGVALLTSRVQEGLERGERAELPEGTEKRSRAASRPQNVQVWLPRAEELQGGKVIELVLAQARALLAAAQEAFAEAARATSPPKTRRAGAPRRASSPPTVFSPDWAGEVRS